MNAAVKCLADYCLRYKNLDLVYYRVNWREYRKLTNLGFGIVTGFKIREFQTMDKLDDGELNYSGGNYGDVKYGHLISLWSLKRLFIGRKLIYVDNYPGKAKYNEVGINHRALAKLVADDSLFPAGYIFQFR